jgi:hypothetical protein
MVKDELCLVAWVPIQSIANDGWSKAPIVEFKDGMVWITLECLFLFLCLYMCVCVCTTNDWAPELISLHTTLGYLSVLNV